MILNIFEKETEELNLAEVANDFSCECDKVNSVQEACAKCFAAHNLKFEILQTTWKNKTKNINWWKTEN